VARGVVTAIASQKGRFLQKISTREQAAALGVPPYVRNAWVYAPEEAVLVKVKQCFRDLVKKESGLTEGLSASPLRWSNSNNPTPHQKFGLFPAASGNPLSVSAAAAAVTGLSSGNTTNIALSAANYDPQRAAVLQMLLQQQQYAAGAASGSSSSTAGPSQNQMLALLQQQQFQRSQIAQQQQLLAKANADTVLRQQQRNSLNAATAHRPDNNDAIINSVLGSPSEDAAEKMSRASWPASAATRAYTPSLNVSVNHNGTMKGNNINNNSSSAAAASSSSSSAPPVMSANERAQLVHEIEFHQKRRQQQLQGAKSISNSGRASGTPAVGGGALMVSYLQAYHMQQQQQQHQQTNSSSQKPFATENRSGGPEDGKTFATQPSGQESASLSSSSLSILLAVLGRPSEPLPSTIREAHEKIQAARWVVAQLLADARSDGGGDSAAAAAAGTTSNSFAAVSTTDEAATATTENDSSAKAAAAQQRV